MFELNNKSIALNVLYITYNTEKIRHAYKSKYNKECENRFSVTVLVIPDGKKWHDLDVKKLPTLLRGVTSKHDGDFYCLNCFHWHSIKDKLKKHYNVKKLWLLLFTNA